MQPKIACLLNITTALRQIFLPKKPVQNQFGEANVQLTFHGQKDGLILVEPDVDYYKDLLAHTILEWIPNGFTGGLSDPAVVYVLRWIAGLRSSVPEFDPLYTIE